MQPPRLFSATKARLSLLFHPARPRRLWLTVLLLLLLPTPVSAATPSVISQTRDDGTELNTTTWYRTGLRYTANSSIDYLGRDADGIYDAGLRFHVDELSQGEQVAYARLRLMSWDSHIDSEVPLVIHGVLQPSPTAFSQNDRPSQKLPKSNTAVEWTITEWQFGSIGLPLYYSSPPITDIVNEILSLPDWGTGDAGKTLAFTITAPECAADEVNKIGFKDYGKQYQQSPRTPAVLDIYRTIYDTFLGKELLGRVTDSCATVNVYSLIATDLCVEYGTDSGVYTYTTPQHLNHPADHALDIELTGLIPDTQYYYRLAYRRAGDATYEHGSEHAFRTQPPPGSSFRFAVIADEHLQEKLQYPQDLDGIQLYRLALTNVAAAEPDFLVSLGDFSHAEFHAGRNAADFQETRERYLQQRECIDSIAHSIPFYLVIGNHEGEQGWYYDFDNPGENEDCLAVWATKARKEMIPNPYPNAFYSGNSDIIAEYGLREDYFAWEWGDAIFVVLDPFWYTKTQPKQSQDNWDWTLGKEQYDWLFERLHQADAKWRFVLLHHLTSSVERPGNPNSGYYGRGGIEVAKFKVAGRQSYEWGGENRQGEYVFDERRPGWAHGPVHDVLVAAGVHMVFHGHDHFFAKQELDGIVYQECPQPDDVEYSYGFKNPGRYVEGEFFPNSGHVQVLVTPAYVKVEYVRAYLPRHGENGVIEYRYYLGIEGDYDRDGDVDLADLATLLGSYGENDGGDINRDGETNQEDLYLLLRNYGVDYSW